MKRTTRRCRRDDSGLTTLEWLLIVATVAGLAALAVVLVTNVVSTTAEGIAGQSARKTAAEVAGLDITERARDTEIDRALSANAQLNLFAQLNSDWKDRCERLKVTFSDVQGLSVQWGYETDNAGEVRFASYNPEIHKDPRDWDKSPGGPTCRVE